MYRIVNRFYLFDYYYPDLFPLANDINEDFDKITESTLNISFTLRYLFK